MRSGQIRTLMLCPGLLFYGVILMTKKDVIQLLEKNSYIYGAKRRKYI